MWTIRAAALAAGIAACAVVPGREPEPAVGVVTGELGGQCPDTGCGTNSPVFDTLLEFHDLSLVGTPQYPGTTVPNDVGLAIVAAGEQHRAQIVRGAQSYDLYVVGGRFIGACGPPCVPIEGTALVGATITLTLNGKPSYLISIDDARSMFFFVDRAPQTDTIDAYSLSWKNLGGSGSGMLCNNIQLLEEQIAKQTGAGDENFARYELMGMQTWETIVFEGDVIDGRAKTMQPYADDNRFNFGCASHLLAKLRLTRNTIHGQAAGMPQAWERRQATMKMLAADYCGSGEPNTVGGQKLVWKGDLMRYYRTPVVIEARWDETGATCLTEPRMLHPTTDLGKKTFPRPWDAIKASCKGKKPLPKCVPEDPASFDGKLRVSGIPEL